MKYIVIVPDGVADEPLKELGGKTPLEVAATPNMDAIAGTGWTGLVQIIPEGMPPGSDVGNMSVLGYDATKGFSGRAPLEAASLGIVLKDDELAFRCNLVTVKDGVMVDYSSGHIPAEEAARIMETIAAKLSDDRCRFYTGKSYRHLAVIRDPAIGELLSIKCTPPHDITNQPFAGHMPSGKRAADILKYMEAGTPILAAHPVNAERLKRGESPANMLWFWGQGGRPQLEPFRQRYGVNGSIISAVDLVNGIGRVIGLDIVDVPGATGYYDTNYQGKADYAIESLKRHDFVYIHVESTDEAGHNGDYKAKVDCIEKFDRFVAGTALAYQKSHPDSRVLVVPDHATPIAKRTHTRSAVPFAMCGKGIEHNGVDRYNEKSAAGTGMLYKSGMDMMRRFMAR
ncbi:MAG: cofactor-independent phosphoglycerate mutase [Candidatus Omnitrophica bacterium]|nr:cofactor-independent phosphoglycerate mutase [Candidatus Omnitrophota bacterium]